MRLILIALLFAAAIWIGAKAGHLMDSQIQSVPATGEIATK